MGNYLIKNKHSYCFRLQVSPELQNLVGQTELRYSLRTLNLKEAKQKARLLAGLVQNLFSRIKDSSKLDIDIDNNNNYAVGGSNIMSQISQAQIKKILRRYKEQALAEDLEDRLSYVEPPLNDDQLFAQVEPLEDELARVREATARLDFRYMAEATNAVLSKHDLSLSPGSREYKEFSLELHKTKQALLQKLIDREYGRFTPETKPSDHAQAVINQQPPVNLKSIKALIADHFAENTREGSGWSPATVKDYSNSAKLIQDFFGRETPIQNIKPKQFRSFRRLLQKIPRGYSNTKRFKALTLDQILKTPDDKIEWPMLSITRINQYLRYLSQLFTYAEDQGYIDKRPVRKLLIQNRRKRTREVYKPDDLKKLFHSEMYLNNSFKFPWQYWLPLIGLYTGARIEEICQLQIEDIKQIEGVWCIDINDHGNAKRLKNQSSKRVIALHPILIKLGFVEYVTNLADTTEGSKIFPELKPMAGKYSHYASKWFSKYKKSCNITDTKLKFHSFRHGFETNLKHNMVTQILTDEMLGHAVQGMAAVYGKKYTPDIQLKEGLTKLDFGIKFDHLK